MGICLAILILGQLTLRATWRADAAGRWMLLAALGLGYSLWLIWHSLPLNRRVGEKELLSDFGPGTLLTISRGVFVACLAGFLVIPRPPGALIWAPPALYWLANLTDFFDGYLARKTNRVTYLGESLDLNLDGFGVFVATLLIVLYGQVPLWYLLVGLARYLFVVGIWFRERKGKSTSELPPSVRRRAFAGVQMGFVGVMLMPVFTPPGTVWAATVFGLLFLSGFLIDWLIVSQVVEPDFQDRYPGLSKHFSGGFAALVRLIAMLTLAYLIYQRSTAPSPDFGLFFWLEVGLLLMIFLGAAGRISAVAALLLMGFYQISNPLSAAQTVLIIASALLFFLGTGPFSLWKPEDYMLDWRPGEQP